jgi:Tol biopolymer transport system component/DNA-binding winged helix-turn-helix (wHTH) protein
MSPSSYRFGSYTLEPAEQRLLRDGVRVPLAPRVFDLLHVLVANAGHLVEKERLLAQVWNDVVVEDANLNRAISVLRRTLGETAETRFIETVPKRGYRFVADVSATTIAVDPPASGAPGPVPPVAMQPSLPRGRLAAMAGGLGIAIAVAYAVFAPSPRDGGARVLSAPRHRQVTFSGRETTPTVSPDGSRVAFVSKDREQRRIVVQELDGGHRLELFTAAEAGALKWSPDGAELLFWARVDGVGGQYIVSARGGAARRISTGSFVGSWAPDGSRVALGLFLSSSILFVDRFGQSPRTIRLDGPRAWMWDVDWSPVHDRLLVVADDAQRRPGIWTIRADGAAQSRLLTSETEVLAARWTPAGDGVYYFARVGHTVSLFKAAIDLDRMTLQGEPAPLVTGLETDEGFGIAADGSRLVYAKAPYFANLWLIDARNTPAGHDAALRQLTHGTAVIERPRVSPDGRRIVFNMGDESRANLYTMPSDGGEPVPLTSFDAFSVDGAWSPDSSQVAFASTEGGRARVWIVNADGTAPRPVSTRDVSEAFDVTWAPGERILYQREGNRNVASIDPRTLEERDLIRDDSVGWGGSAEYAPDGASVAVSWNRRPSPGVWRIASDGSFERLIHGVPPAAGGPPFPIGWSPDGQEVVAIDGRRAAYRGMTASFEETVTQARILRIPVNGDAPDTLLAVPFDEVGSVAMFPDGRRFVASVYSSRSDVWIVDNFDARPAALSPTRPRGARPAQR